VSKSDSTVADSASADEAALEATGPETHRSRGNKTGPMDKLFVYRRWCKGCGICVEFCPKDVFEMGADGHAEVVYPERCSDCGLCAVLCPDFAIKAPLPRSVRRE